jgi:hypothetical protein
MDRACTESDMQYFTVCLVYKLYRRSLFYVTHCVGQFLLATCHLTAYALIIQEDDKIDVFASVKGSCGPQIRLTKQDIKKIISVY